MVRMVYDITDGTPKGIMEESSEHYLSRARRKGDDGA